ncbi:MAG TPA: DUF2617 family protein [Candidatus Saccharimonadales bacterium]
MPQRSDVYIDQSPDELCLNLVEGAIDPSLFTTLGEAEGRFSDIQCKATVIGASHIVTFAFGPFVLNEVFACMELPAGASSVTKPIDEIGDVVLKGLPGLAYSFNAQQVPWPGQEPPELLGLEAFASVQSPISFGVVEAFPQGDLPAVPKTIIVGYEHPVARGIVIETAHSYPGQGVVFSRSQLIRI